MSDEQRKKVDESWKEQVEREKQQPEAQPAAPAAPATEPEKGAGPAPSAEPGSEWPEARFDVFVSSLAMDALIALGDAPHPGTRRQSTNLPQARYVIDLLGVLEEKTRGNTNVDEARLLKDTLYQLRMRYLAKSGTPAS